jgi:predicted dehydrogenase
MKSPLNLALVGCGGMARHHLSSLLKQTDTTRISAICEPNAENYEKAAEIFDQHKLAPPPCEPDFDTFVKKYAKKFDAAFVITPHNQHLHQASTLLNAGKDVLLEKPMVLNTREANALMKVHRASGRLLMIAFNGSASPAIRAAAAMLRAGELGRVLSVHAVVWQDWKRFTDGTWRQQPKISGGGFMFDTGAHLLNTVADLLGESVSEVAAFMDNCDAPVDIQSVVIGRTASNVKITLNAIGNTHDIGSEVRVICERGTLLTGVWGEYLRIMRQGEREAKPVELPASLGVWETFLRVRNGEMQNPCPPEIGLRMIQLWDAIRASAKQGGAVARVRFTKSKAA